MNSIKPMLVLSVAVISASAILSINPIRSLINSQNIITTTNGAVRLGEIYEERLVTEFKLMSPEDDKEFIAAEAASSELTDAAMSDFRKKLKTVNEGGGIPGEDGKKSKFQAENVTLKKDMKLKLKTYIHYRSEYQQSFSLVVDETDSTAPENMGVQKLISDTKVYTDRMIAEFQEKHALLRPSATPWIGG